MSLAAGTQLGPYEIIAQIGAGGMGEVYRARDPRLRREVAIKVLPSSFSSDADRLQRFEQEAHAAAGLNHPNILAVYDIGRRDGSPYIVSELLQGETLRDMLRSGPLPQRKAMEYAIQIAHGLAAAHDRAIVHRDLKPENIFITGDGRVKLLDFGLAKLVQAENTGDAQTMTATALLSEPGTVLGTVGYMSPEQVRAKPVDARSDLFSFGVILYEMLSGKRAFLGESAAETMSAIVKEDPPDLTETNRNISPALERIVRHCLEKNPGARFQSAHDLAFALEAVSGTSKSASAIPVPEIKSRSWMMPVVVAVLIAFALAAAFLWGRSLRGGAAPEFHQLTFRNGTVYRARFAPDGSTILYSAAWEGKPIELYTERSDSVESRSLAPDAVVGAVSSKNQVAVLLKPTAFSAGTVPVTMGTLAVLPLEGGAPRPLMQDIQWVDWTPDGSEMAVVRFQQLPYQATTLLFPADKPIYTPERGWISDIRFSPNGKYLAFEEHVPSGDDGKVVVVDRAGKKIVESPHYDSVNGMAWASNNELWYTGAKGSNNSLQAMNLRGRVREVYRAPNNIRIYDISANGRVLLSSDNDRLLLINGVNGGTDQDLSWFNWSLGMDISGNGSTVVFSESAAAVNGKSIAFMRNVDRSPAVALGDGLPTAISPDGTWVATIDNQDPSNVTLLPTGVGRSQQLTSNGWDYGRGIHWTVDGKALILSARESGHAPRTYLLDVASKKMTPLLPEGVRGGCPSPDGKFVAGRDGDTPKIYTMEGNEVRSLPKITADDSIDRWSADGKSLFVWTYAPTTRLDRMDVVTGQRVTVGEIKPPDLDGVVRISPCHASADGKSHICSEHRLLTDLFVVSELN